nr:odorant binding protein 11 [Ceracris nigricornis]
MVNHGIVVAVAVAAFFTILDAAPPPNMAAAFAFAKEIMNRCQQKWPVPRDIIERMQRNRGELPDEGSSQQRCFQECVAKEMGVINNGGGIAADKIVNMVETVLQMTSRQSGNRMKLDSQALRRDITNCEFKGEDKECKNSLDTMKCLRRLGTPENMKRYITRAS